MVMLHRREPSMIGRMIGCVCLLFSALSAILCAIVIPVARGFFIGWAILMLVIVASVIVKNIGRNRGWW
jgi:hypothetical protein